MIFPQPSQTQIILDALYPQLSEQDPVVVQCGKELHEAMITAVSTFPWRSGPPQRLMR